MALTACVLGMFVITLDAVVVNVALPSISRDLGGGITGLQWVADGYTLMFAALLLSGGAFSDRIGARNAFALGVAGFVIASALCGLAPNLNTLIAARFLQGAFAAVVTPSSIALLGQTFPDPRARARAVGIWAMGGAVASTAGPVLGGLLTAINWRWIFFLNVPVGIVALALLARTPTSKRRPAPLDWIGQITAVLAMGGLTFGAIEGGARGFTDPTVIAAFAVAILALAGFLIRQARAAHPMMPLDLFHSRTFRAVVIIGFAFVFCYFGLPFFMSLYLQQIRGLSAVATGIVFLPMMIVGAALNLFSARFVERFGRRQVITTGLLLMVAGFAGIAAAPATTPVWVLSTLMLLVGLGGPTVMPPATAALLDSVPAHRSGIAGGVLNTSRQLGGALAVAIFGALLANPATFVTGVRICALIAAARGHRRGIGRPSTHPPPLRVGEPVRLAQMVHDVSAQVVVEQDSEPQRLGCAG